MKIEKQISVSLSESEIVRISRTDFDDVKNHIAVIDFQIEELYRKRKITGEDLKSIRNILLKVD
tara:strand:+ start:209 stop:400 length:192 start_codon:yes stop_codon:yes gene_type:complete